MLHLTQDWPEQATQPLKQAYFLQAMAADLECFCLAPSDRVRLTNPHQGPDFLSADVAGLNTPLLFALSSTLGRRSLRIPTVGT